ncbi:transposase [Streptomyces leeuwenhoekii]|uniref:transposase n=1 Tax=Streptomyces leeuwenhoekii TaxID=1437453 RepID=UPI00367BCAB1
MLIAISDLFCVDARSRLEQTALSGAYAQRVASLLHLIDVLDAEAAVPPAHCPAVAQPTPAAGTSLWLPCVGPVLAVLLVAEIGDVHRFASAEKLRSWAGLSPRCYGSDPPRAARAKIAAIRKLLTLVYYGPCDGHIRAMARFLPARDRAWLAVEARWFHQRQRQQRNARGYSDVPHVCCDLDWNLLIFGPVRGRKGSGDSQRTQTAGGRVGVNAHRIAFLALKLRAAACETSGH